MTEDGKKWVEARELEKAVKSERPFDQAHALSLRAAEFWIRAFCEEVEKRSAGEIDRLWSAAFYEVKHELLGDTTRKANSE